MANGVHSKTSGSSADFDYRPLHSTSTIQMDIRKINSNIETDDRAILEKERLYQRFAFCMCHLYAGGRRAITEEMSTFSYIPELEKTSREVVATELPLFESACGALGRPYYRLTALGNRLWLHIRAYMPMIEDVYADQVFNPYVAVLLKVCKKWEELFYYCRIDMSLDLKPPVVQSALNRIARLMRRIGRSASFKREVNNYRRAELKNLQSCRQYVTSLLDQNPQLLIVRVDLYYLPEEGAWANIEEADACHEKFLRALRRGRIVPDLKGYISKRNNGVRRGMHYQLLVAMDGDKHASGQWFSNTLGHYWAQSCAGDKKLGSFFSCYAQSQPYRFNYLGLVRAADEHAMKSLDIALRFLTKGDHQLKTGGGRDRNLRRGAKPKPMAGLPCASTALGG